MKKAFGLVVLLWGMAAPGWAQDGGEAAAPAEATAAPAAEGHAAVETAWLTADTPTTRFLGDRTPGPDLRAGTEVTVLVRDGDHARVMAGTRFGWLEAAKLTSTKPEGAAPSPTVITLPAE